MLWANDSFSDRESNQRLSSYNERWLSERNTTLSWMDVEMWYKTDCNESELNFPKFWLLAACVIDSIGMFQHWHLSIFEGTWRLFLSLTEDYSMFLNQTMFSATRVMKIVQTVFVTGMWVEFQVIDRKPRRKLSTILADSQAFLVVLLILPSSLLVFRRLEQQDRDAACLQYRAAVSNVEVTTSPMHACIHVPTQCTNH